MSETKTAATELAVQMKSFVLSDGTITIKGMSKAVVLAALYNAATPQGMGFIQYNKEPMTVEQAQEIVKDGRSSFDYLYGRVMKIDIGKDAINPSAYDRDNGKGAAEKALAAVRSTGNINSSAIQEAHVEARGSKISGLIEMLSPPTPELDEQHFVALGRQPERINFSDSGADLLQKMGEGHARATQLLSTMLNADRFMNVLALDSARLYGSRIWDLYQICGEDMERFVYHLDMELPNQATGKLWVTGPYWVDMTEEEQESHVAARQFGKPGSFWALENPPTDPNYEYPIMIPTEK